MPNEISNIQNWFVAAKPNHTLEDACVQIGCHFEEVAEMIESIFGSENQAFKVVNELAVMFKQKRHPAIIALSNLTNWQKQELLDSLCDQVVTSVGVGQRLNMNIIGALNNVIDSNWSKFEGGKPVFNEQGKIAKGRGYFAPDLTRFIGGEKQAFNELLDKSKKDIEQGKVKKIDEFMDKL